MKETTATLPRVCLTTWKAVKTFYERRRGKKSQLWQVRILSSKPVVLVVRDYALKGKKSSLHSLLRALVARETVLLVQVTREIRHGSALEKLADRIKEVEESNPFLHTGLLADSKEDCRLLREAGLFAEWVHHGCFVDTEKFHIKNDAVKSSEAVLDARFISLEADQLLLGVKDVGLITFSAQEKWSRNDLNRTSRQMDESYWFNDLFLNSVRTLQEDDFNEFANQGRVGLDLTLGNNPSSPVLHYLLAGLPVVSTSNRVLESGLFDPSFVLKVEASPTAVAEGVQRMKSGQVSPVIIREETMCRIDMQRSRLRHFIENLQREKRLADFSCAFPSGDRSWDEILTAKHGCSTVGSLLRKLR